MIEPALHLGDCIEVMPTLDACSVDTIITDPPYGLSFMVKKWDHCVPGEAFWVEALRVAKPGAFMLAFGGTRTFHRLTCAIEDAGWQIRDCVMWVYGSGFPKSLDIGKALGGAWTGYGTALKPAWEPIIVAMKPCDGTFANNALTHGVAGLDIDGGRVAHDGSENMDAKQNCQTRQSGDTVTLNNPGFSTSTYKPSGRWPANLIHDGSDEATSGMGDASRYFKQCCSGRGEVAPGRRLTYCAKASKKDRDAGCEGFDAGARQTMGSGIGGQPDQDKANNRNTHPTVKPAALMDYLCNLTRTPTGGIVLDPFMGSGSTGCACMRTGRSFIGIEMEQEHYRTAEARIEHARQGAPLLAVI